MIELNDGSRFFLIVWGVNSVLIMFLLVIVIVRHLIDLDKPKS